MAAIATSGSTSKSESTVSVSVVPAMAAAAAGELDDARHSAEEALRLAAVVEWTDGVSRAQRAVDQLTAHTA